ncbi:hypothetical protein K432DRAFT_465202 [Lepidopterella palustris CBS 459.81]|uniref:F-box domain-containing protein n=1 Tax=Lepidopterella palustris CBS 459.81 TaxID=1314670 RepID=A0A8E2E1L7_9PEZI|nr:hypothetical protein K432DRAFT_465202 [Lepidopterella palustris CBS 459.81]
MAPNLDNIAVELLDIITSTLSLEDFCSLRLTCKSVYATSLRSFAFIFFSSKICHLNFNSLELLTQVSRHVEYSQAIRSLDIQATVYSKQQIEKAHVDLGYYKTAISRVVNKSAECEAILQCAKLYDHIMAQPVDAEKIGTIANIFTEIFRNLVNVKAIRLYQDLNPTSMRNYNSSSRIDFASLCFQGILEAVSSSGLKLEKLKTVSKPWVHRFSRNSAIIPHDAFIQPKSLLTNVLANLSSLELCISTTYHGMERQANWETGVSKFISGAVALKSLRLLFDGLGGNSKYSIELIRSITEKTSLPKLKKFHLVGPQFDELDLADFFVRHRETLRVIHFEYTRLQNGTWQSLLETIRDSLQLHHLYLLYPVQGEERVTFPPEIFDNFWLHQVDADDPDDDRSMKDQLNETIEFLEVGFERHAVYEILYDSDAPMENSRRRHSVSGSDHESIVGSENSAG